MDPLGLRSFPLVHTHRPSPSLPLRSNGVPQKLHRNLSLHPKGAWLRAWLFRLGTSGLQAREKHWYYLCQCYGLARTILVASQVLVLPTPSEILTSHKHRFASEQPLSSMFLPLHSQTTVSRFLLCTWQWPTAMCGREALRRWAP